MDMAAMFGFNPYIIVERYTAGQSCSSRNLASIKTFLADSRCHRTETAASYKATRKGDGSVTIDIFTDSSCSTDGMTLTVTAAQALANSCANDANGILDTKVYFSEVYLLSTVTYESGVGGCKAPVVPTQLFTTVATEGSCEASSACIGTAPPYNGTLCSSTSNYQNDVAAAFGPSPYVIVEKYTAGKSCDMGELSSIQSYIADTKCHRTSSTTSFRAIRKTDGSSTIMTYANSGSCRFVPKTFAVTTDQAIGNSYSQGSTGVVDTKLYGGGATPLFLTVTAVYDNTKTSNCMAPAIPMQWVATTLSVDDCVPTVGCQYSGPLYTSTVCSNTKTYQQDVAAAFGWNQYVTVESYIAGKGCAQSALARVATYLADGYCHSSSSTKSFIATSGMDGLLRIDFYTSSSSCGFEKSTLTVTAAQAKGNMCISTGFMDIKVFTPY